MFSEACERNKIPIGDALARFLKPRQGKHLDKVLEIGSGTGQHAEYLLQRFHNLYWQPSDVAENLSHITQRLRPLLLGRCLEPILLDLNKPRQLHANYDIVFTANTLHIVNNELVERLIRLAASVLCSEGMFFVYGPFNYGGSFSSQSNAVFDEWLKRRDSDSGIRDIEKITAQALSNGLMLVEDIAMPANNQLLVFKKTLI